ALQEAGLRLGRSDTGAVANLGGWLTTVVGRVCLDMLRARRSRQEDYVGSWLPEPIVSLDDETDPEQEAILANSVGLALLVVLETLTPAERLAFVIHDMFAVPFEEIAPIVGCRAGPGKIRRLARPPITGADAVATELLSRAPRFAPLARPALVNGTAGLVVGPEDRPFAVVGFTVARGRIVAIDLITNPDKF